MTSNNDNQPVHVTGDTRRHPAIRKLARACIELARVRLQAAATLSAGASGGSLTDIGNERSPKDTQTRTPEPEASND